MTLQDLISKVEYDLKYYSDPDTYDPSDPYDDDDYTKCKAKADYAEEVLVYLLKLKAAQL